MFKVLSFIAVFILLVGCQSPNSSTPPDSTAPASLSSQSNSDVFVGLVNDELPAFSVMPDSDIVELAGLVCESFDAGNSFYGVVNVFLDAGFSAQDAGGFIGASVAYACPEYAPLFNTN